MPSSDDTSEKSPPPVELNVSLDSIAVGRELAKRENGPDAKDQLEEATLKNGLLQAQIDDLNSNRSLREGYEFKVFWYLVAYSLAALAILLLCGFEVMELPENVLVAISGSTALAAIGLVAQIGRGLFPAKDPPKE